VTLTSVGAGAIGVTVLMILYPLLPLPRIVAADIAYAVPLTLVAGFGHASLGSVDWPMLASLLVGSLPGIWVGSHLMSKTPERVIRSLLSVLLAYAGFKLIALCNAPCTNTPISTAISSAPAPPNTATSSSATWPAR
jgi:uncharacterized membrane protein YfcA